MLNTNEVTEIYPNYRPASETWKKCPTCNGYGLVPLISNDYTGYPFVPRSFGGFVNYLVTCSSCGGKGHQLINNE